MTEQASVARPGWYADPHVSGHVRYWNGATWTERRAPHPAGAPALMPPPPPAMDGQAPTRAAYRWPTPTVRAKAPGSAVAALWTSLASVFLCAASPLSLLLGVAAVVCGIVALRRIQPGGKGAGMAITGIVVGGLFALIGIARLMVEL